MTRKFTAEQLEDLLKNAQQIDSRPWRQVRLIFEHDGVHWSVWVNSHHSKGLQIDHPIMATAVERVQKTVWAWEPTK